MKTVIVALIFLLLGGAMGGFLALGFGVGMGVSSGFVYGAQTGICVAAQTAAKRGLLTGPSEADGLIAAAVQQIRAQAPPASQERETEWVGDAATCRAVVDRLESGQSPPPNLYSGSSGAPDPAPAER